MHYLLFSIYLGFTPAVLVIQWQWPTAKTGPRMESVPRVEFGAYETRPHPDSRFSVAFLVISCP
jgi:hypothetical protein